MNRSAISLVLAATALVAGLVGLVLLRPSVKPSPAPTSSPVETPPLRSARVTADESKPSSTPAAPGSPPAASATTAPDERTLMATLRALRGQNPELSLRLARDGNLRFQDSPDAAERSWVIVKSLSDLGRHEEARVEGRTLVERYRDTRWAEDVYRHLFVNPPTHPFERGYGKVLEQDP